MQLRYMSATEPEDHQASTEERLASWKAIAAYLKRDITTVQRWERREGMPVHRHVHDKRGSVYAFRSELDAWRKARSASPDPAAEATAPDAIGNTPKRTARPWLTAALILVLVLGASAWWMTRAPAISNPLANARISPVTDFDGVELAATLSRDGELIGFLSDRDGAMDVWITKTGSSDFRNLTRGAVPELANPEVRALSFTPDGALLTFWTRDASGAVNVLAAPVEGGALRTYLPGAVELDFSNAGSHLVFHTTEAGDPTFVRSGAEDARPLFAGEPGSHNHFQTWSPDDRYIYFVRGIPPHETDIWRVKLDSEGLERLTHHNTRVLYPTFVATDALWYLATEQDGSGPWLYSLDVNTKTTRRISFGLEQYTSLAASADRKRLVVTVKHSRPSLWRAPLTDNVADEASAARVEGAAVGAFSPRFTRNSLVYVAAKGDGHAVWEYVDGAARELWSAPRTRVLGAPAVAPNGTTLAFAAESDHGSALYRLELTQPKAQIIAPALEVRGAPAWAPDGKSLVVSTRARTGHQLVHVSLDGATPPRVLADEYAISPQWSPDGSFVLYSAADAGPDYVLKAVKPDGSAHPLPTIRLPRPGRRAAFVPGQHAVIVLQGDMRRTQFWRIDLESGERRPLTSFQGDFTMRDFDIAADGGAIVFDRREENSDVALIELAAQ